jgi:hypothetical protein
MGWIHQQKQIHRLREVEVMEIIDIGLIFYSSYFLLLAVILAHRWKHLPLLSHIFTIP